MSEVQFQPQEENAVAEQTVIHDSEVKETTSEPLPIEETTDDKAVPVLEGVEEDYSEAVTHPEEVTESVLVAEEIPASTEIVPEGEQESVHRESVEDIAPDTVHESVEAVDTVDQIDQSNQTVIETEVEAQELHVMKPEDSADVQLKHWHITQIDPVTKELVQVAETMAAAAALEVETGQV